MVNNANPYRISKWLAEFSDPDMEASFQRHIRPVVARQFRIALIVWIILLLLFAIPDYFSLGPTRPFYYLLAYRAVSVTVLIILLMTIKPETNFYKLSYPVMWIANIYMTGFMLFFIYRPDAVYLVIGVIMIQLAYVLVFLPIRFMMAFSGAIYGVAITLLTRWAMGTTPVNLVALFIILLLPVGVGALTTNRNGILQRREFALRIQAEKISAELQKALSDIKQLSGLLPICSSCKKIRNDEGYWEQIEGYIRDHTEAEFSHSICPDCAKRLYPEFYKENH